MWEMVSLDGGVSASTYMHMCMVSRIYGLNAISSGGKSGVHAGLVKLGLQHADDATTFMLGFCSLSSQKGNPSLDPVRAGLVFLGLPLPT